jgi:YD repeat-containing protein
MRINAHFCCRAFMYLIAVSSIASSVKVYAQSASGSGGISATGQQEITLQPNRVRLILQIQAEGRDAKTAIKNLADHKSKINAALKEMNADMASVVFEGNKLMESIAGMPAENPGSPRLISPTSVDPFGDQDAEAADSPAKIVTAKSTVTAEWALPTEDIDALSLLPEALKQQVQQRDLQGKKIRADLSDEEKEVAADYVRRIAQQRGNYYSNTPAPQDVQIVYVASTTREQEKEALKAAYQEAVANAQLLAEASGQKLGKIRSISRADLTNDMTSTAYEYDAYGNAVRRTVQKRNLQEITSTTPTQMSKKVGLTVVFGIE